MPEGVIQDFQFVRELAKVSQVENLSKLSAFFRFCSECFAARRIFAERAPAKPPNFFRLFSCQISSKTQKSGDFSKFFENLCVTAPKTNFEFNNSLIFKFR